MNTGKAEASTEALVIGGGIAGLLAAEVLCRQCAKVTLVERDELPAASQFRSGVPQSRHIHRLLMKGLDVMEAYLPGIGAELEGEGALQLDLARDLATYSGAGWLPRFSSGLYSLFCSRELVESVVRRRVLANGNLELLQRHRVEGLEFDGQRGRVTGVTLRDAAKTTRTVRAGIVVDASGRSSKMPAWLEDLGLSAPATSVVDERVGYASRCYVPPPGYEPTWDALFVSEVRPSLTRSGGIFPLEGGRWLVTLAGSQADYPGTGDEAFLEFAGSLASPIIYDVLRHAQPCSPIYGFRDTESRWRHYETVAAMPDGLVVLGDAYCTFNPVHGQGMTTAVLGADLLGRTLGQQGPVAGWNGRFHRRFARLMERPWVLATPDTSAEAGDAALRSESAVKPSLTGRLLRFRMGSLKRRLHDPRAYRRFIRIHHLTAS